MGGGRWDVLTAQRSSVQKLQHSVSTLLCRAQTCISRLDSWPSRPRKALAPQAVSSEPSCQRSGGGKKWRTEMHVPITRYEMQPAGKQSSRKTTGSPGHSPRTENRRLSVRTLPATVLDPNGRVQRVGSRQSVKPASTTRHCCSLVSRLPRLLPLFGTHRLQTKRRLWAVGR